LLEASAYRHNTVHHLDVLPSPPALLARPDLHVVVTEDGDSLAVAATTHPPPAQFDITCLR
jgi:hypothetical protein